ncbi:MAG: isopentenyl phosphate kinase family protein [Candidatus Aenigmarchaeota archaeon]|nr:isopentenyl phosphate kinase family protein [Candidatus Aenigmarchaeota archaeon]
MASRKTGYSIPISPVVRRYIDKYPELMEQKNIYVLKLGGSIITDKKSNTPRFRKKEVERMAKEIKSFYNPDKNRLLIVHGAGSFGHPIVDRSGIDDGIRREDQLSYFSETQEQVTYLNYLISQTLRLGGIQSFPYQVSSAKLRDGEIKNLSTDNIELQLKMGMVPVLYGAPAVDVGTLCSILSGDQLGPYMADAVGIKKILYATDVDGVFDKNPKEFDDAKLLESIDRDYFLKLERDLLKGREIGVGESSYVDVTGGMIKKLEEAFHWTKNTEILIFNGTVPENIKRALSGERIGTLVKT